MMTEHPSDFSCGVAVVKAGTLAPACIVVKRFPTDVTSGVLLPSDDLLKTDAMLCGPLAPGAACDAHRLPLILFCLVFVELVNG